MSSSDYCICPVEGIAFKVFISTSETGSCSVHAEAINHDLLYASTLNYGYCDTEEEENIHEEKMKKVIQDKNFKLEFTDDYEKMEFVVQPEEDDDYDKYGPLEMVRWDNPIHMRTYGTITLSLALYERHTDVKYLKLATSKIMALKHEFETEYNKLNTDKKHQECVLQCHLESLEKERKLMEKERKKYAKLSRKLSDEMQDTHNLKEKYDKVVNVESVDGIVKEFDSFKLTHERLKEKNKNLANQLEYIAKDLRRQE
jgi:hypothetical protein